ncbi:MAG TPA: hypothetical protein PKM48_03515 [Parvularculaceae bacterium]|nr:hypothetical protein [Parvularculaceae bacterium]HNS86744.1 hypothetical protein [Parvularculaceae bacterium]
MKIAILFAAFALCACATPYDPPAPVGEAGFAYIVASGTRIETTHRLRFAISAARPARVAGPIHRRDTFNGRPYEISLAAILFAQSAVVVHAERVADGSGASDYDALAVSDWPAPSFRRTPASCLTIPHEDVVGEHDLDWLNRNGFDPAGDIYYQQYFATTADHNDEIVVTLMARTAGCADGADADIALQSLREAVAVLGLS